MKHRQRRRVTVEVSESQEQLLRKNWPLDLPENVGVAVRCVLDSIQTGAYIRPSLNFTKTNAIIHAEKVQQMMYDKYLKERCDDLNQE